MSFRVVTIGRIYQSRCRKYLTMAREKPALPDHQQRAALGLPISLIHPTIIPHGDQGHPYQASGYPCSRQRWGADRGYTEIKKQKLTRCRRSGVSPAPDNYDNVPPLLLRAM